MADITAGMVKELREKTDAPMMECKKALTEAGGDLVKAEELLRVKLGSKASKAASRPRGSQQPIPARQQAARFRWSNGGRRLMTRNSMN